MAEARSEDLTLAPNEFALVLDKTSGIVHTYCGPSNASLSAQEIPVVFDGATKRFLSVDMARAKQLKQLAPEGWYIILKNPAENTKDPTRNGDQPEDGKKAKMPTLRVGHKINIPGPTTFALWPGQMAQVVQGHHLRQDEYLIARVYDGDAARRSLEALPDATASEKSSLVPQDLTPGYLFIIKGTEASFYVPPTGIEVVRESASGKGKVQYVRSAVSLERLEYCLLRDQDGNKRYVRGPAVVFPEPTEEFITNTREDGTTTRKFKAIELGPKNGIHVKVIADYGEGDEEVKAGTELFITGEDTPIYFPREEHAIIKYGDSDVNFGVAIPPGEARYVLQRLGGEIRLEKGPQVFLPDARTEIIIRRALDLRLCALMYPGNTEALQVNQRLAAAAAARTDLDTPVGAAPAAAMVEASFLSSLDRAQTYEKAAPAGFHGDSMNRQGQYRPPRTITLDSKYDGAVTMDIHEGYAVMLVTKRGGRRVVIGPQTALLEYDEVPHVLTLSTGKPKTMDKPFKTVYLMIANNYVTDIIEAETQDYCKVKVKLSYRLNFEGAAEKWFSVENYVKLLCDHMRSMVRNRVRHLGIKEFYHNATDILRDLILGASVDPGVSAPEKSVQATPTDALDVARSIVPKTSASRGSRPGRTFDENGLRIFDVEVLEVALDAELQKLLERQERATIQQALELEDLQRKAHFVGASKVLHSSIIDAEQEIKGKQEASKRALAADEAHTKAELQEQGKKLQEAANAIAEIVRQNQQADADLKLRSQQASDALKMAFLMAETEATKERMGAVTPNLVASLQAFGDQATIERLATAMGAQGFLRTVGGESIVDVLTKLLQGTSLAERLPAALNGRVAAAKQLST